MSNGHRRSTGCFSTQYGGRWSPEFSAQSCEPISCGEPPRPQNGHVNGDSFSYGDTVNYRCLPGFGIQVRDIKMLL